MNYAARVMKTPNTSAKLASLSESGCVNTKMMSHQTSLTPTYPRSQNTPAIAKTATSIGTIRGSLQHIPTRRKQLFNKTCLLENASKLNAITLPLAMVSMALSSPSVPMRGIPSSKDSGTDYLRSGLSVNSTSLVGIILSLRT